MEKTRTDYQGRIVPTPEFREHVQDLTRDVEDPWRNDGLVAYVYHQTNLDTDAAAQLLGTTNSSLQQQSKAMRYRHHYRDVDTGTEYDDPLDDRDLLHRLLVDEGMCPEAIEAVLRTGYLETRNALQRHGLLGVKRTHRNREPFMAENLAENRTG